MSELISLLLSYICNPWIIVTILGFLPFTEVRIAVLYGIIAGLNPLKLFFVATAANILETIVLFMLIGNKHVMTYMDRIIGKKIEKKIKENKKHFEKYEELALIILVAAPVPGMGAIMGLIAAKVLEFDKKKSLITICVGIMISAALVLAAANFFILLFGWIFK